MDWGTIGTLGLGAAIGQVTSLLDWYRKRKDRRDERLDARIDAGNEKLRVAYEEFFSTYKAYIAAALLMGMMGKRLAEHRAEIRQRHAQVYEKSMADAFALDNTNPELLAKSRKALDDYFALVSKPEPLAARIFLLEDNKELGAQVLALAQTTLVAPQPPPGSDGPLDYDRFFADAEALDKRLDAIVARLAGSFSSSGRGRQKLLK